MNGASGVVATKDLTDIPLNGKPVVVAEAIVMKKESDMVSYEDNDPFYSFMFLGYMNSIYNTGHSKTLELEDLGHVSKQDETRGLYERFTTHWTEERKLPKEKRSLWMVLWRTVGWGRVGWGVGLFAFQAALSYGPILILNALVRHFQGTAVLDEITMYVLVCLIFVLIAVAGVAYAHSNAIMAHLGVQFRNVLVNAIYRKSLLLSPSARQGSSTGQIVNMFSNDTKQLQAFLYYFTNTIIAPFQIIVCIVLIYFQMQEATFVGVGYMVFLLPANGFLFYLMNWIRKKKVEWTDLRVKLMNEILSGIRIIKYYAWEKPFEKRILEVREEELRLLTQLAYVTTIGLTLIMMAAPIIQPVLIFYTYVKLGNQLDAATAFTTLSLFNLLAFPFAFLPLGLAQYSQSRVSTTRMLDFFDQEELENYVDNTPNEASAVSMTNAHFSWELKKAAEEEEAAPTKVVEEVASEGKEGTPVAEASHEHVGKNRAVHTLTGISFSIPRGALVAVVGPVGSGKSSLLNGLLGELILTEGQVRLAGSVAYCDQRPWILNATIRDNILFGLPYDEARFEKALLACNLHDDVRILPGGLLTEIGERGINLSGGQKARVALARAVYRDADVYLLDDPLSAVDAHVGQWLFNECLKKELAGKTRVLVTHQVHLLDQCDLVLVLVDGELKAAGTFDDLANRSDINLDDILGISRQQDGAEDSGSQVHVVQQKHDSEDEKTEAESASESANSTVDVKTVAVPIEKEVDGGTKIITLEEKNDGEVKFEAYSFYIRAGGIFLLVGMLLFAIGSQVLALISTFWLAHWGEVASNAQEKGKPLSSDKNVDYLNIFAMYSLLGVVALTIRSILIAYMRLGASLKMHRGLLTTTLAAPVAFFDITPVGRVLNRFSSDMLTIDEELAQTLMQMSNSVFQTLGAVGAVAGATNGTFLVLLAPMVYLYGHMQSYFRKSNTAIARLESVSRSPIYADFSQALNGITTIRAYRDEQRFIDLLEDRVNSNTIAAVMQQVGSNWLSMRLDFFGAIISFFVALLAALTIDSGFLSPGLLAVGLTYSFLLTNFLKFAVRMIAQFEAQMNSVERVKYYIDKVEAEEKDSNLKLDPPSDWPDKGTIVGKNVQMRYRDGPLVLKGVDFSVGSTEKVGVVGRTGSGKSSLMVALFRIQELDAGQIFIDGVDCATVPLSTLRSKLGIIPQDPVMFSASLRFNLDPFSEHSDKDLWDVLRSVNMDEHVSTLPSKLLEEVAEGGDNFSAGQRQLICIARALLRKPKILVMDEATASVDNDTDALIQSMVREQFKDSTILTIAHRLHTIIDYDKIMVLDSGSLAEMGTPSNLLEKDGGAFKSLWSKHQSSHGGMTRTFSNNSLSGASAK